MTTQEFEKTVADVAIANYPVYGILPSITIAQAALESGWGNSGLTQIGNALFGIKAGSDWSGKRYNTATKEVINGEWVATTAYFRAYDSLKESIIDHARFLNAYDRYEKLIFNHDWQDCCDILGSSGYATDPDYSAKLKNIIEQYALYQYDYAVAPEFNDTEKTEKTIEVLVQPGETVIIKIVSTAN